MHIKAGEYKVIIDNNGNQSTYDANGNLIHYKDTNGYGFWYAFDVNGNQIHYKNSTGYESWRDYDANGNEIHYKNSTGNESWADYDANGNLIHCKTSNGYEFWYDANGNKITKEEFDRIHNPLTCEDKIIEIDGKQYKLTAI